MIDKSYWTCAVTHPSQEQKALQNLHRQKFEAFFPFFLNRDKYNNPTIRPLFPGYVFIKINTEEKWKPINNTHGISYLLKLAGSDLPAQIPDSTINSFPRMISNKPKAIPNGAKVKILKGAFEAKEAIVKWSNTKRIKLLFALLGREVEFEMDYSDVKVV